jgi:hypothetical protein
MKKILSSIIAGMVLASLLGGCASVFVPEPGFLNEGSTYYFSTEPDFGTAKVLSVGKDGWVKLEKEVGYDQKVEFWYNTHSGVFIQRAPEFLVDEQEIE